MLQMLRGGTGCVWPAPFHSSWKQLARVSSCCAGFRALLVFEVDGIYYGALIEFLSHGFKYVFPPAKRSMARGVPTNASAEPLKSRFLDDGERIRRNDVHSEHWQITVSCYAVFYSN